MTDIKLSILEYLYNSESYQSTKLKLHGAFAETEPHIGTIIRNMLKAKTPLISEPYGNGIITLTEDGISAFEAEMQIRNKTADRKAEKIKEDRLTVANFVISLILGIIGIALSVIQLFF